MRDLKRRYGLLATGGELHAKDFCVSINEQAEVPGFRAAVARGTAAQRAHAPRRQALQTHKSAMLHEAKAEIHRDGWGGPGRGVGVEQPHAYGHALEKIPAIHFVQ